MVSYYNHLKSTKSIGEQIINSLKPTFRSSAIFPVLHNKDFSSKVLFMGYWLLKRHIKEIGLLYTLRDESGAILDRKYILVESAKAFSIELNEFSAVIATDDFIGSLEMEVFSTQDLVFPYPAFVLVYYNDNFSTAVHTTGRIYNDIEDLSRHAEYVVAESGFDIHSSDNLSPFIALSNGSIANEHPMIRYEVITSDHRSHKGGFSIAPLAPYATTFVKLKEHINLTELLHGEPGTIKISHNMQGIFPRFVAGNFEEKAKAISITHTYYDSSQMTDANAYWNRKEDIFIDSSSAVPLYVDGDFYTRLAVYPVISPSEFKISLAFYDEGGNLLSYVKDYFLKVDHGQYDQIDFKKIVREQNIDPAAAKSVKLICNWDDKDKIPTRVKFGLNVDMENRLSELPSNICFAMSPGNPLDLKKKTSFHWAPFINIGKSDLVLINTSTLKEYNMPAHCNVSFHREQDAESIKRTITIPANGTATISIDKDPELKAFFDGRSGWMASLADNTFIKGYYFDFFENGNVAADHVF
jgi:hypothetical protein